MTTAPSLSVLLVSTFTIAVVHALAPDHWLPFVSLAKARGWSKTRLAWITFLCGLGHVGSSIAIGSVGLLLGFKLTSLSNMESGRAEVAGLLLIGFGLAYSVWGLKRMRDHHHHVDADRATTFWALFVVFLLGPCEPLIPLMFVGAAQGWSAVLLTSALFAVVTLFMMVGQTLLGFIGLSFIRFKKVEHFGHIAAGLIIALTGGMVMFLGI